MASREAPSFSELLVLSTSFFLCDDSVPGTQNMIRLYIQLSLDINQQMDQSNRWNETKGKRFLD